MKTVPYFYFNGNAAEAIAFYTKVFSAKPAQVMLYKEMPHSEAAQQYADKVLHAEITLGDDLYYISDAVGENEVKVGDNLQINLNCDTEEELRRLFSGLSVRGNVTMPIEDTFWGAVYGSLTDQFGISWSLNYQKPQAE
jgi:PhnB protein